MIKATRAQWIKFVIVLVLWLVFLVWLKSWLGLVVVPFIFDAYITKKIPWTWWRKSKNPTVVTVMGCRCYRFCFGGSLLREFVFLPELCDSFFFTGKVITGG